MSGEDEEEDAGDAGVHHQEKFAGVVGLDAEDLGTGRMPDEQTDEAADLKAYPERLKRNQEN